MHSGPSLPLDLLQEIVLVFAANYEDLTELDFGSHSSPEQQTLKSLCRTNRILRSLAQPILFNHVNLSGPVGECMFRARKLMKMLDAREESRNWIKALRLSFWPSATNSDLEAGSTEEIDEVGAQLFARLTHLQVFQVNRASLTPEMCGHLYNLPQLRILGLIHVNIPHLPSRRAEGGLPIKCLHLYSPSLEGEVSQTAASFANNPGLTELVLGRLNDQILADLLPYKFQNLLTLCIKEKYAHLDLVVSLASACPALTSLLSEEPIHSDRSDGKALTERDVPHLAVMKGSLRACQAFVPGRPIGSICVVTNRAHLTPPPAWSKQDLVPLTLGTSAVHKLELVGFGWTSDGLDVVMDMFPLLETLVIHFYSDKPQVSPSYSVICEAADMVLYPQPFPPEKLLDVIKRLEHLGAFHYTSGHPNVHRKSAYDEEAERCEREVLDRALEARPTLTEVAIGIQGLWTLSADGKTWSRNEGWRSKYGLRTD